MTCEYCQTDHEAQNCPNCGAPQTSRAEHRAYRINQELQAFIDCLPISEQIARAEYEREMKFWCSIADK